MTHPLDSLSNTPIASRSWRLRNLYTIRDAYGVLQPYQPNLSQRAFYNRRWYCNLVLKARKLGFSTHLEVENLDALIFTPGLTAGIIDYKLEDAKTKLAMLLLAWDHLDNGDLHPDTWRIGAAIKAAISLRRSAQRVELSTGSYITCSTSHRGSSPNRLHLSELGKTSIWAPIKAKEILNGALNSITPGNVVDSESTHEGGRAGIHYNLCQTAMRNDDAHLTNVDFRFHFFAWWQDPRYTLQGNHPLRPTIIEYFAALTRETGRTFTHGQMLWYDRKQLVQGHGMKKEFPSTPGEAFEAISEGAIYGKWMADLRAAGRITDFGAEPHLSLFTFWDLGHSDYGVTWLIQPVGRAILVLDWHERSGGNPSYWADHVRRWEAKWNRPIARHFLPHDANSKGAVGVSFVGELNKAGVTNTTVVPRVPDVWLGIGYTKDVLPHCWFHATHCDTSRDLHGDPWDNNGEQYPSGVACLEGYHVNLTTATLREMPEHDQFSHSCDGFRTFAEAWRAGLVHAAADPHPQKPKALR